jgi:hypothetical protein
MNKKVLKCMQVNVKKALKSKTFMRNRESFGVSSSHNVYIMIYALYNFFKCQPFPKISNLSCKVTPPKLQKMVSRSL